MGGVLPQRTSMPVPPDRMIWVGHDQAEKTTIEAHGYAAGRAVTSCGLDQAAGLVLHAGDTDRACRIRWCAVCFESIPSTVDMEPPPDDAGGPV